MSHPQNELSADILIKDNQSPIAENFLNRWNEDLYVQNISVILGCSEPRLIVPSTGIAMMRSIGATALPELYDSVLNEQFNPRAVIVMTHHDGETVKPHQMPKGCGGLGAKAMQGSHEDEPHKKLEYSASYIDKYIIHSDPFIHGLYTGHEIAERSRRPTLVVTQDHRTGTLYPLASFIPSLGKDLIVRSAIPLRSGFEGRYNPSEIYRNGIPHLTEKEIPYEFGVFMRRHNLFAEQVRKSHPNLYTTQKMINPSIVALTTELRSMQARFPTVIGVSPNTIFTVTVPRDTKQTKNSYTLDLDGMKRVFDQTHYAFAHALEHEGNPQQAFSSLYGKGTLLIEGDNIKQLNEAAEYSLELPYIKEWSKIKGNKIILMETNKGRVLKARQITN